ncbi:hypothetical protein JTB14_010022 [Gonioctena quinquepunctata]|nr:hypothetical protein JTB14_010022 [Gonioctena quinquepunctata]
MVKICEVCGLKQFLGCDKTFHRIPSDVVVAESWCNALMLNRSNLKRKFPVICSSHFLPHHVIRLGSRTVLSKNAIPTCEMNIIDMDDQSTSRRVCDEKPDLSRSVELGEIDAKEQSFSTTLTASEFEDVEILSSSTLTAPEALTSEEWTQGFDGTNAGDQSFSTTLTASEIDDVETSSSTSTAPEALTEIQNILKNEPLRKRFKTSTSAASGKLLEIENTANVSLLERECRVHSKCIFIWNCKRII